MYNYKLVIQYDGTRYDGWQRMGKDESINTIEYKIAEILRKMTGEEIQIFCGCRTEKGVHARGQETEIRIVAENILKTRNKLNEILAANTGKSVEEISRDTERDNYMTAQEAVAYGLIDSVVEKR